jgi:hypothetical protein
MTPDPSHFALADHMLELWRAAGYEALFIREDRRVVPTRLEDVDEA